MLKLKNYANSDNSIYNSCTSNYKSQHYQAYTDSTNSFFKGCHYLCCIAECIPVIGLLAGGLDWACRSISSRLTDTARAVSQKVTSASQTVFFHATPNPSREQIISKLNLNKLVIDNSKNPIHNKKEAFDRIVYCYQKGSDSLNLSELGISSLPKDIFKYLPKLKNLDLSHNSLTSITDSDIPSHLEKLDLRCNKLDSFNPPYMPNLTELHISDNSKKPEELLENVSNKLPNLKS